VFASKVTCFFGIALLMQGCGEEPKKEGGLSCAANTKQLCLAVSRFGGEGTGANSTESPGLDQTGGFPLPANIEALCEAEDTVIAACEQHCAKYETKDKSENTPLAVGALRMCLGKALIVNNLYQYDKSHCAPYLSGVCAPEASWTPQQKAAVQADSARQDSICNSEESIKEVIAQCEETCIGNHDEFKECVFGVEDSVSEKVREAFAGGTAPEVVPQTPKAAEDTQAEIAGVSETQAEGAAKDAETAKLQTDTATMTNDDKTPVKSADSVDGEGTDKAMMEAVKAEENAAKGSGAEAAMAGMSATGAEDGADVDSSASGKPIVKGLVEVASHKLKMEVDAGGATAALS